MTNVGPSIDVRHVGCGGSVDVLPTVPYMYAAGRGLQQKVAMPIPPVYYAFRCRKCGLSGGNKGDAKQ